PGIEEQHAGKHLPVLRGNVRCEKTPHAVAEQVDVTAEMALANLCQHQDDIFHISMVIVDMSWHSVRTAKAAMIHGVDGNAARGQHVSHIDVPAAVPSQSMHYEQDGPVFGSPTSQEMFASVSPYYLLGGDSDIRSPLHAPPISRCP